VRWYSSDHGRRGRLRHGRTTHSATAAPLSCKQQYKAWKNGAAKPVGNKLKTELTAIQTAGRERRYPGPAGRAESSREDCSPAGAIPGACVRGSARLLEEDLGPHPGAGDNAGADTGLTGLILAEAPLKDVPALEKKLDPELKRTT
jgi:hypothetical protein